jgi:hypothetical protein
VFEHDVSSIRNSAGRWGGVAAPHRLHSIGTVRCNLIEGALI